MQPLELGAHIVPELGVEIGERFVQKQKLRPADQRAAERNALLLASRQCRRLLLKPMRKLQHLGGLADALRDLRARKTVLHQRIGRDS